MQTSTFISSQKIIFIRSSTVKSVCLGILLLVTLWLLKSVQEELAGTYIRLEGLQSIQISSSEYPYFSYFVREPYFTAYKRKSLSYKTTSPLTVMPPYDHHTFTLLYEGREQVLLHYSPTLNAFYNNYHLLEPSANLKEALLDLGALYRQEAYKTYGALVVWEEANKLFPMYATAKITDIYSGNSFNVQRREGDTHVDAQPLTADDTAIMKKIYGGQWSWERKGIIVEVQGCRIAASMHGMPHGAGKIDDNNFPGHFCIHFLCSTIHGAGMDIGHHREILKAAGMLPLKENAILTKYSSSLTIK